MVVVWIVVGLVGAVIALFVLLWFKAVSASARRDLQIEETIGPALEAASQGSPEAQELVTQLASQPVLRNELRCKLEEMGKADLFPEAMRSVEKMAESELARWLLHPNELGAAPAEIEVVRRFEVKDDDGREGSAYLIRFRAEAGHWAAENGWMAGVAGPYWEGDHHDGVARGTFSELTPFDALSEEQHIEALKKAIARLGWVVPS
jgi:hypothetical protein